MKNKKNVHIYRRVYRSLERNTLAYVILGRMTLIRALEAINLRNKLYN